MLLFAPRIAVSLTLLACVTGSSTRELKARAVYECGPANACQNGGTCEENGSTNESVCTCLPGFGGYLCEVDFCNPNPCNNGICTPEDRGYACSNCPEGYFGDQCQIDICEINTCEHGTCVPTINGKNETIGSKCNCQTGFMGAVCSIDVCATGSCQHSSAICTSRENSQGVTIGSTCTCPEGFTGTACEVDVCGHDPCDHGECQAVTNSAMVTTGHVCKCDEGYLGLDCSINICDVQKCENDAVCIPQLNAANLTVGRICSCSDNHIGSHCETDVCDPNPCLRDSECSPRKDKNGRTIGHQCTCKRGTTGLNCAIDVCDPSPCNSGQCSPVLNDDLTTKDFKCTCPTPHTGKFCEIDVCETNPCMNGGLCEPHLNDEGLVEKAVCKCGEGFMGDYCGIEVCSESASPCLNGGSCHAKLNPYGETTGSYCTCTADFSGPTCANARCDDTTCGPNAVCGLSTCACRPGYELHNNACIDVNECLTGDHTCDAGERCDNTDGSFDCVVVPPSPSPSPPAKYTVDEISTEGQNQVYVAIGTAPSKYYIAYARLGTNNDGYNFVTDDSNTILPATSDTLVGQSASAPISYSSARQVVQQGYRNGQIYFLMRNGFRIEMWGSSAASFYQIGDAIADMTNKRSNMDFAMKPDDDLTAVVYCDVDSNEIVTLFGNVDSGGNWAMSMNGAPTNNLHANGQAHDCQVSMSMAGVIMAYIDLNTADDVRTLKVARYYTENGNNLNQYLTTIGNIGGYGLSEDQPDINDLKQAYTYIAYSNLVTQNIFVLRIGQNLVLQEVSCGHIPLDSQVYFIRVSVSNGLVYVAYDYATPTTANSGIHLHTCAIDQSGTSWSHLRLPQEKTWDFNIATLNHGYNTPMIAENNGVDGLKVYKILEPTPIPTTSTPP